MEKKSRDALEAFDDAAKYWGLQQDRGVGSSVDYAERQYQDSKRELIERIESLENTIHKYRYGKRR